MFNRLEPCGVEFVGEGFVHYGPHVALVRHGKDGVEAVAYVREDGAETGVGVAVSMDNLRGIDKPAIPKVPSRVGVDPRFEELIEEELGEAKRLFACGGLRRDPLL